MNKKNLFFFSCVAIFCVATVSIVFAKNNSSPIATGQMNSDRSSATTNRAERILNSRKRHRDGNDSKQRISPEKYLSQSVQKQQTAVNINSSDLRDANVLTISVSQPQTQLTATVSLNGQDIKNLTNDDNTLDLSPYLTLGKQIVSISGNYTPDDAAIKIEFKGKTTQISQETQGSGQLEQQFIFNVK